MFLPRLTHQSLQIYFCQLNQFNFRKLKSSAKFIENASSETHLSVYPPCKPSASPPRKRFGFFAIQIIHIYLATISISLKLFRQRIYKHIQVVFLLKKEIKKKEINISKLIVIVQHSYLEIILISLAPAVAYVALPLQSIIYIG